MKAADRRRQRQEEAKARQEAYDKLSLSADRGMSKMPRIVAYTYEADVHCVECTKKRFPPDEFGSCYGTDREGNEIHPVFSFDEWPRNPDSCGTCHNDICLLCGITAPQTHVPGGLMPTIGGESKCSNCNAPSWDTYAEDS